MISHYGEGSLKRELSLRITVLRHGIKEELLNWCCIIADYMLSHKITPESIDIPKRYFKNDIKNMP